MHLTQNEEKIAWSILSTGGLLTRDALVINLGAEAEYGTRQGEYSDIRFISPYSVTFVEIYRGNNYTRNQMQRRDSREFQDSLRRTWGIPVSIINMVCDKSAHSGSSIRQARLRDLAKILNRRKNIRVHLCNTVPKLNEVMAVVRDIHSILDIGVFTNPTVSI